MEEQFLAFVKEFTNVPLDEWEELDCLLKVRKLKRSELLVHEGATYQNEVFVSKGVIRAFHINDDGEEVNIAFYQSPDVLSPYFSRTFSDKSLINYQALEDTVVLEFNAVTFSKLIKKYRWVSEFANKIVEKELLLSVKREKNLLNKNAEKKYAFFKSIYPHLETRISQIHVASFLGISPVSLSRLRGKK